MHLGRFHRAIDLLDQEYVEQKINDNFVKLINSLNSVASNPTAPDVASSYKSQLENFRDVLQASKLNHPRPILKSILDSIDAQKFIGDKLFERIKTSIANNQLVPALAAQELTKLQATVNEFFGNIKSINNGFTKLRVEYDNLGSGEAEIGLLIPRDAAASTLQDFSKELKQWHNALAPITEIFDPTASPIQIKTCSTTDWMIYLASTPPVLAGISLCLKGVNSILKDVLETRNLVKQLAAKDTPKTIIDALEENNGSKFDQDVRKLAEKLVADHYHIEDKGRENELTIGLTQALKTMAQKVSTGAKIELKFIPSERPEQKINEETGETEKAELSEEDNNLINLSAQLDNDAELLCFEGDGEALQGLLTSTESIDGDNH